MEQIILKIGCNIRCFNLPEEAKTKIARDLTFDNPKYLQAKKSGMYISSDLMPFLYFFATNTSRSVYQIPRGYLYYLKKYLNEKKYQVKIEDNTLLFPKEDFKFYGKLRDYQNLGVDDMIRRYPVGVLEASTGAGKTVMGCGIIARRKQPTLIIVHNKELLYQWQGAIKQFLHYDCGLVGDGKFDIKKITVGIVNTVRNKVDQLRDNFGQVIIDECHRCPSTTFSESLQEFPARHYLGLSATPFRRDGLGFAIQACIGPKIHTVSKEMLQITGAVLRPTIFRVETGFRYFFRNDYSTMIKKLAEDEQRNELIASKIYNDFKQHKQNVLVVSDRVAHCKNIADILEKKYRMKALVLSSNVKADERKRIVNDVKAGRCNVLISTLQLIGEGFDAPNLSSIFLTTPVKFSGRLLQVVGRVLRPEKGKKPRVYDFRDSDINVLRYSGFNRDRIYKKEWN